MKCISQELFCTFMFDFIISHPPKENYGDKIFNYESDLKLQQLAQLFILSGER